jgi:ABC-type enterochelin transport system ATPase subunit
VPYRFVGMLTENGKPSSVYLSLGATLIDARPGDVLEGGYQLQSITARQLNFLHQQSNLTVPLTVDGEPL